MALTSSLFRSPLAKYTTVLSQPIRLQSTFRGRSNNARALIPTWNDYFKLRKKRRMYEVASYLPSTVVPAAGTASYFFQMQIDPFTKILGMDPIMAAAVATISAGFGGFLLGPVVGNTLFKLMNRRHGTAMDLRDKEFYNHIKKNRADARLNSVRNPVPDYYGEKIQSVHDYRAWLRKQREFYRKGVFGGDMKGLED
ncbi:mitochondrial import protein Pam17 [Mycotypha africana]|uniref:mitochondrial import protein Pam17 n=1 Tax=Mycotypha africana TaxID=64632 RepID=UPI0023007088|nr:mitochondrial import protein Pam17 [Mycotypha africana]KAI8975537.1 mitochondrial import protein Pam17 [Mycotypha africana]